MKPKMAANTAWNEPVMPEKTTDDTAEPIFQPIGPSTKCAAMTERSSEQNGTTIIETT